MVGSAATLSEVYADVLVSLDPSLNICVDAALKQQEQPLLFLVELKESTKHFAHNLQSAVLSQGKVYTATLKNIGDLHQNY